jgi:hypothetical protein
MAGLTPKLRVGEEIENWQLAVSLALGVYFII